jgi:hypothetical protein
VLTVRYEDIALKFEATIKRILEFTGDPMVNSVLNWHRCTQIKEHSAWFGLVEPLQSSRIGRWRKFNDSAVVQHFLANKEAMRLLSEFEYV